MVPNLALQNGDLRIPRIRCTDAVAFVTHWDGFRREIRSEVATEASGNITLRSLGDCISQKFLAVRARRRRASRNVALEVVRETLPISFPKVDKGEFSASDVEVVLVKGIDEGNKNRKMV